MDSLDLALSLRDGLRAWQVADPVVDRRALSKAFRDNWDRRIGGAKFGGVWSIGRARTNPRHPASREALRIGRGAWRSSCVTVEHAIPVRVLFDAVMAADSDTRMRAVIEAYDVAVVTRDEEARLRAAGLASRMPEGWCLGDDPRARWRRVGIEVGGIEVGGGEVGGIGVGGGAPAPATG